MYKELDLRARYVIAYFNPLQRRNFEVAYSYICIF